jgi:hypothetical protein
MSILDQRGTHNPDVNIVALKAGTWPALSKLFAAGGDPM